MRFLCILDVSWARISVVLAVRSLARIIHINVKLIALSVFERHAGGWVRMRTKWLSCFSQEIILDFFNNFRLSH